MPASHTYTLGFSNGAISVNKNYVCTGDGENNIDVDLLSTTSIQVVAMNLTVSTLKGVYINSSYLTELRTNATVTYGNLFTLLSDKPMMWTTNFVLSNPFTTNVTDYRFYNTSGTLSRVQGFHLYDASI